MEELTADQFKQSSEVQNIQVAEGMQIAQEHYFSDFFGCEKARKSAKKREKARKSAKKRKKARKSAEKREKATSGI